MTDCVIRSRIDPAVKAEATALFAHMGLTVSEAVRLFVYQSVADKAIPFSINLPNAKTQATLRAIDNGKELTSTSLEQLSKDWDR